MRAFLGFRVSCRCRETRNFHQLLPGCALVSDSRVFQSSHRPPLTHPKPHPTQTLSFQAQASKARRKGGGQGAAQGRQRVRADLHSARGYPEFPRRPPPLSAPIVTPSFTPENDFFFHFHHVSLQSLRHRRRHLPHRRHHAHPHSLRGNGRALHLRAL